MAAMANGKYHIYQKGLNTRTSHQVHVFQNILESCTQLRTITNPHAIDSLRRLPGVMRDGKASVHATRQHSATR